MRTNKPLAVVVSATLLAGGCGPHYQKKKIHTGDTRPTVVYDNGSVTLSSRENTYLFTNSDVPSCSTSECAAMSVRSIDRYGEHRGSALITMTAGGAIGTTITDPSGRRTLIAFCPPSPPGSPGPTLPGPTVPDPPFPDCPFPFPLPLPFPFLTMPLMPGAFPIILQTDEVFLARLSDSNGRGDRVSSSSIADVNGFAGLFSATRDLGVRAELALALEDSGVSFFRSPTDPGETAGLGPLLIFLGTLVAGCNLSEGCKEDVDDVYEETTEWWGEWWETQTSDG